MNKKEISYFVLKVGNTYLHSVWEDWDDDENYLFTEDLSEAMSFSEGQTNAPKYLWNSKEGKSINTLEEACKYFGGEMKKVYKVTTWNEL